MTQPRAFRSTVSATGVRHRVSPSDLVLPPTQPIDITALIDAETAVGHLQGTAGD
jgi:hypothetical protein